MFKRLAIVAALSICCLAFQSCALIQPPPQDLVTKDSHAGLGNYYKEQAQELREKAKLWDTLAESTFVTETRTARQSPNNMRRIAKPLQPRIERRQTKLMRWQSNTGNSFRTA